MLAESLTSLFVGSCNGNRFLVLDDRYARLRRSNYVSLAKKSLANYGADSLLVVGTSDKADVCMRIYEKDGSESDSCGNGALLVSRIFDLKRMSIIETRGGLLSVNFSSKYQCVVFEIKEPDIRITVRGSEGDARVRIGEPHLVRLVDDIWNINLDGLGEMLQRPYRHGINVDVLQKVTRSRYLIRTYERGVNAETKSCGTGAVAAWVSLRRMLMQNSDDPICFESAGGKHWVARVGHDLVLKVLKTAIEFRRV